MVFLTSLINLAFALGALAAPLESPAPRSTADTNVTGIERNSSAALDKELLHAATYQLCSAIDHSKPITDMAAFKKVVQDKPSLGPDLGLVWTPVAKNGTWPALDGWSATLKPGTKFGNRTVADPWTFFMAAKTPWQKECGPTYSGLVDTMQGDNAGEGVAWARDTRRYEIFSPATTS